MSLVARILALADHLSADVNDVEQAARAYTDSQVGVRPAVLILGPTEQIPEGTTAGLIVRVQTA